MGQKLNSIYPQSSNVVDNTLYKAYRREKLGKREAERVIEEKSREIYYVNKKLELLNVSLEKKVLERTEELNLARERAEESGQAKERFLANMSHEIRTPINAIVGFTDLLMKCNLDEKERRYIDAIKVSSENLKVIINDILDFSKIEAGKLTIDLIDFKFSEIVQELVYSFLPKASENDIELDCYIDEGICEQLRSDPIRIKQILNNLLSNAVKFTQRGKVQLRCELIDEDQDVQNLRFIVEDSGIGIQKENLDKIFEGFSQEDQSITRKFGGTGLGLTICKELTILLGGTIDVISEFGTGTQFEVKIPLGKTIPVGIDSDKVNKIDRNTGELEVSAAHVLLVEDNEFNQMLVESIFEGIDMSLNIANNGKRAVEMVKNKNYDVILMDIQMPVMDGMEATRVIRNEIGSTVPILAFTANALKEDRERYIQCGMNDYISKPFTEQELFEKMKKLIVKI